MTHRESIDRFFYGPRFQGALRATIGGLVPAFCFGFLGHLNAGISLSVGAVAASFADLPSALRYKRKEMLACAFSMFLTVWITGLASSFEPLMWVVVVSMSFFFSLFAAYGIRINSIGFAALLVMVLSMDNQHGGAGANAMLVLGGGLWYAAFSLSACSLLKRRLAQQSVAECVFQTAAYLRAKTALIIPTHDLKAAELKLASIQVVLTDAQQIARELLFTEYQDEKDQNPELTNLLVTLIDLDEHILSAHADYRLVQDRFGKTPVIHSALMRIEQLASILDLIGLSLLKNSNWPVYDLPEPLPQPPLPADETLTALGQVLGNINESARRISALKSQTTHHLLPIELSRFAPRPRYGPRILISNLKLSSPIFRHALRVMIGVAAGAIISEFFPLGHSYWILLTILVIMKPEFGLSRQKNTERLIGTTIGCILGGVILYLTHNPLILMPLLFLFQLISLSLRTVQYTLSVICLTLFMLIVYALLGVSGLSLIGERFIDTVIGSIVAFSASWLFPYWEYQYLKTLLPRLISSQVNYLETLTATYQGVPPSELEYRLARKQLTLELANLGATFQRMLGEPENQQPSPGPISDFLRESQNLAAITTNLSKAESIPNKSQALTGITTSIAYLHHAMEVLNQRKITLPPESSYQTVWPALSMLLNSAAHLDSIAITIISDENKTNPGTDSDGFHIG
ncbi:MAG: FUSC family protein [Pseudomonadota bacterium]|nr:FUSC family protein [Pseudomonadota bacterium]